MYRDLRIPYSVVSRLTVALSQSIKHKGGERKCSLCPVSSAVNSSNAPETMSNQGKQLNTELLRLLTVAKVGYIRSPI